MQHNERISNHMARQECYGKIPSFHPGLHDTIPSGKDTGKPARSSDLSRGQSNECCPGMRQRNYSKNWNQTSIKKKQQSYGKIHGCTKPAIQNPTKALCRVTQLFPRHDTPATTVITHKTH